MRISEVWLSLNEVTLTVTLRSRRFSEFYFQSKFSGHDCRYSWPSSTHCELSFDGASKIGQSEVSLQSIHPHELSPGNFRITRVPSVRTQLSLSRNAVVDAGHCWEQMEQDRFGASNGRRKLVVLRLAKFSKEIP